MKEIKCADCGELKPHLAKGLCPLCYKRQYSREYYRKMKEALERLEAENAALKLELIKAKARLGEE